MLNKKTITSDSDFKNQVLQCIDSQFQTLNLLGANIAENLNPTNNSRRNLRVVILVAFQLNRPLSFREQETLHFAGINTLKQARHFD